MAGSPGFSRWDACRGRRSLPGTPGPAEAGTPAWRDLDQTCTVHKAALREVLLLIITDYGIRHTDYGLLVYGSRMVHRMHPTVETRPPDER
jgi:hypothetical protein